MLSKFTVASHLTKFGQLACRCLIFFARGMVIKILTEVIGPFGIGLLSKSSQSGIRLIISRQSENT